MKKEVLWWFLLLFSILWFVIRDWRVTFADFVSAWWSRLDVANKTYSDLARKALAWIIIKFIQSYYFAAWLFYAGVLICAIIIGLFLWALFYIFIFVSGGKIETTPKINNREKEKSLIKLLIEETLIARLGKIKRLNEHFIRKNSLFFIITYPATEHFVGFKVSDLVPTRPHSRRGSAWIGTLLIFSGFLSTVFFISGIPFYFFYYLEQFVTFGNEYSNYNITQTNLVFVNGILDFLSLIVSIGVIYFAYRKTTLIRILSILSLDFIFSLVFIWLLYKLLPTVFQNSFNSTNRHLVTEYLYIWGYRETLWKSFEFLFYNWPLKIHESWVLVSAAWPSLLHLLSVVFVLLIKVIRHLIIFFATLIKSIFINKNLISKIVEAGFIITSLLIELPESYFLKLEQIFRYILNLF